MREWLPTKQQVASDVIASSLVTGVIYLSIWGWNRAKDANIADFPWQAAGTFSSWQIATIAMSFVVVLCVLQVARITLQATAVPIAGREASMDDVSRPESDEGRHDLPEEAQRGGPAQPERKARRQPTSDDFIDRFGVLWRRIYIPKVFTLPFRSMMETLGARPSPGINIEHIPYCPNDNNQLDYQDSDGHRSLFDEDDVGGYMGSAYCTACNEAFRLAPGYRNRIPLREFWKQVDAEYGRD